MAKEKDGHQDAPAPPEKRTPVFLEAFEGMAEEFLRNTGERIGRSEALQRFVAPLPVPVRWTLAKAVTLAASGFHSKNKIWDEVVKELGTGVSAGLGVATAEVRKGLAEEADAAAKALRERPCRIVKQKKDNQWWLHDGRCLRGRGGDDVRYADVKDQQGVQIADCCEDILAAAEAEAAERALRARTPHKNRRSVMDVAGEEPAAFGLLLQTLLELETRDAVEAKRLADIFFAEIDRPGELAVIRYLKEAVETSPEEEVEAGLDAAIENPLGAAGAGVPELDATVSLRRLQVWALLVGMCPANPVVLPDPKGPRGEAGVREGARFIRLLARSFPETDGPIEVVCKKLDSELELRGLLACSTTQEVKRAIDLLDEKSSLASLRESVERLVRRAGGAAGPAKGAFADVTNHVGSVLDEASAGLDSFIELAESIAAGNN